MALSLTTPPDGVTCLPGDVVVREVHTGFIVGRMVAPGAGPGPWWHYIDSVATLEEARLVAHMHRHGMRAWLHMGPLAYELPPPPLTSDDTSGEDGGAARPHQG